MRKQVGQILVEAGIISSHTLDRALAKQRFSGKRIGVILNEMGVVTNAEVVGAVARQFEMKVVKDFASRPFAPHLLQLIPEDLAIRKHVFPLKQEGMMLAVAVTDPYDTETLEYLAHKTHLKILPVLATPADVMAAIRQHYLKIQKGSDKLRILVIDDAPSVVMIVETALLKEGYDVMTARDGLQGVKLALTWGPDLIISDAVMPQMDGYALLRTLRENPLTSNVPVILLTAKTSPEEEHEALRAGFADFITKPVVPLRIISRVNRALGIMGERTKWQTRTGH